MEALWRFSSNSNNVWTCTIILISVENFSKTEGKIQVFANFRTPSIPSWPSSPGQQCFNEDTNLEKSLQGLLPNQTEGRTHAFTVEAASQQTN